MTQEIKETITKGQAVDIADARIFNEDVKSISVSGEQENRRHSGVLFTPRREVDFEDKLDFIEVDVNGIYSYKEDKFEQRFFVTDDRNQKGIRVHAYAHVSADSRRDGRDGYFSIYFDNREQIISFANKCLDMLLITEETGALKKRYEDSWTKGHPDVLKYFPSLLDQTKCLTGRFYWDSSLNKVREITKDTPQDILDAHSDYDTDEHGNFEQNWTNEKAEELLAGLYDGLENGWDNERFNGVRVAELQTGMGGSYGENQGIVRVKGKNPEDKRKKQWTTTFYYTNGTSETKIGYWERLRNGNVRRNEWRES